MTDNQALLQSLDDNTVYIFAAIILIVAVISIWRERKHNKTKL